MQIGVHGKEKKWEPIENAPLNLQEMLDECLEKEAAAKRRRRK
jgi:hypothetical protein